MHITRKHSLSVNLSYLVPVLLAILIMLPRMISPQFGFFDDGKSIITAQELGNGSWNFKFDSTDARFRPIYWLSFSVIYLVFGEYPIIFFFLNMLVLCATAGFIVKSLLSFGATRWQAGLAGSLFVLSGTVIENFYTLSKGEWLQVFFIASSLAIIAYTIRSTYPGKITAIIGSSLLLLCASLSKETSVIMLPISLAWFILDRIVAFIVKKQPASFIKDTGWRGAFLISNTIAFIVYFMMRASALDQAITPQGYTERFILTFEQITSSALRWAGWLTRDFAYVALVLIVFVFLFSTRKRKLTELQIPVDMLVWMAAWIIIYLPWNFMNEYYMLPFAFGAAVFSGLVLGDNKTWENRTGKTLAILAFALFIPTLVNTYTTARIQLLVDKSNALVMDELANLQRNAFVLINIQSANEYTDQIQMQLKSRFNRDDLNVQIFNPASLDDTLCKKSGCFIVSPFISNQPLLTVRLGLHEPTQNDWNNSFQEFIEKHPYWQKTKEIRYSFRMISIDYPRIFCPFIKTRAFCATPSPFVDTRPFSYGWEIYQLETP